jgi:hypothetical protein
VHVRLSGPEVELLSSLPALLDDVGADPRDPAGPRLNQSAYPDDPIASAEFEVAHTEELAEARAADRAAFAETLQHSVAGVDLDEDQAASWMRVVGEARLAIAARLGIDDDRWEREASSDPTMVMVHYLTHIQSGLVDALAVLMDVGPDD